MKNLSLKASRLPIAATFAATLAVAGCATLASAPPEQQVKERATAFWNARLKADPEAAYALLAPAYRGVRTEKEFVQANGKGITAQKVEVGEVKCEEEKCTASVAITAKPSVPGLSLPVITSYMDDVWVREQDQWWRYQAP